MINAFSEITAYDGLNFQEHLKNLNLFHLFEPIFTSNNFEENELHIKIIQYIAFAFSIESPKLSLGGSWRKEASLIFKDLGIDDKYYDEVVILKSKEVLECVQAWMRYKDSRQIEYLFTLQTAYTQQQKASLENLKKADGVSTDYDQKMKCIQHMTELKGMVKDAESELQQNDVKLKESYMEVKKAAAKYTVGPETFAK
jgi:hypothetical protein